MARDDFSSKVKDSLGKRVNFRCSNPACNSPTAGPHSEPDKSISIGVAAHIAAASPGGPRYDEAMTPEDRASADNGIWLCQNCAKLIDSDARSYSRHKLTSWKVRAELRALRDIEGETKETRYYPQPHAALHAPIPRMRGLPYCEARQLLEEAGWQPKLQHWSHGEKFDMTTGNGLYFWGRGFHEIQHSSGTGLSPCTFAFSDIYGNALIVTTVGEVSVDDEEEVMPGVWSWHLEKAQRGGIGSLSRENSSPQSSLNITFDQSNPGKKFWSLESTKDESGKYQPYWEYRAAIKNHSDKTLRNVKVTVECIGPMATRPEQSLFDINKKPLIDLNPNEEALVVIRRWYHPPIVAGMLIGEDIYGPIKLTASADDTASSTKLFHFDPERTPMIYV